LDVYAGLFDDDLRALADRLDERIAGAHVARMLPMEDATVVWIDSKAV